MKAQKVYENVHFERGRDPRGSMRIGIEGILKGKSLRDLAHPSEHSQRCAAEIASEFQSQIDLSKIFYIGTIHAGDPFENEEAGMDNIVEKLLPYITDDKLVHKRMPVTGTVIRVYDTPYGRVTFEGQYGEPPHGTAWAEKETFKNLYLDQKVNENVSFEREKDPKRSMGLGTRHLISKFMEELGEEDTDDNALIEASKHGKVGFVEYLLSAGADVHAKDDWALQLASENGHTEVVKVLLAAGADVHAEDDWALRWASGKGYVEVVKVLLAAGANVHTRDDWTLRWASENGHKEVVKILKDHIAKEKSGKIVKESIACGRGADPKTKMGLGLVTIELYYHKMLMDEDDPTKPDMEDEDTAYAVEQLEESGLQYKFTPTKHGSIIVTLKGSRDQMGPFVAEYLDDDVEDIKDAMYQWDGREEGDFWKLAGY
jgi:hypothetical protein